jgi:hypothetical protein
MGLGPSTFVRIERSHDGTLQFPRSKDQPLKSGNLKAILSQLRREMLRRTLAPCAFKNRKEVSNLKAPRKTISENLEGLERRDG